MYTFIYIYIFTYLNTHTYIYIIYIYIFVPSLKLTVGQLTSENGWLEDEFPFGAWPIFRDELLVSGRVCIHIDDCDHA